MIRFRIHDPSALRRASSAGGDAAWDLRSAFLVGVDGRPTRGVMEARPGEIAAAVSGDAPFGISMLVDLAPADAAPTAGSARIQLQTCFLPQRTEPYELFLEFARWTIKQFIEDCERWQMWSPSRSGEAFELWEAAREAFREALRTEDAAEAERISRRSVALGIAAAEALAMRHANLLLARRYANRGASGAAFGVCIEPDGPPGASAAIAGKFDVVALRTPWRLIEPREGKHDFKALDAWVKWAVEQKKRIVLGPLVDLSTRDGVPGELPDHVLESRSNPDRMRELIWYHARRIADRYKQSVRVFIPVSGANCAGWQGEGIDRMVEYVRTAVFAVRDVRQDAQLIVEIRSPGAESWRGAKGAAWPASFVQRLVGENLSLAAFGLRFEQGGTGDPVRDLMTNARLLDGYLGQEAPVIITGFGVPSSATAEQCAARGAWRDAWSPARQLEWADAMLRVALSRGFVEAAWWSRLDDSPASAAGPDTDGLVDAAGQPKPVLDRLLALRRALSPAKAVASGKAGGRAT